MSEATTPTIGGTETEEFSTSQESIPVPYIAGTRKVGVNWLTNTYNQRTVEVEADTGKKGGSGKKGGGADTGVYDYYGSIAAAVCMGSVDVLVSISFDGEQVWKGDVDRSGSDGPFEDTIAGYGDFHFYWGTETQTLNGNSILKASNNDKGEGHPDYRGVAFIEFRDILFGREKVTAPNVEIVVSRQAVEPFASASARILDDGQNNPLCAVAELLTNTRYGLGMSPSLFNPASFQNTATAIHLNKDLMYCSPFLDKQEHLRAVLNDMTDVSDSFLVWGAEDSLIHASYWNHGVPLTDEEITALPLITLEDLTESPDMEAESWSGIPTGFVVTFSDREKLYKRSSDKYEDLSLVALTGEPSRRTLSRLWITRREQAIAHASEWSKTLSRPSLGGELAVRRAKASTMNVGDLFRLDVDIEPGGVQAVQVCRLLEKTSNQVGAKGLTFKAETNLVPLTYTPDIATPTPDTITFPKPEAFVYVRPMELPPSLSETEYGVAILAQRADNMTVGYGVLFDTDNSAGEFPAIGNQRTFAVRASLQDAFTDSDTVPRINTSISNQFDLDNFGHTPGEVSAEANQYLLIAAEIEGSQIKNDTNGFAIMEVMSVVALTLVSPDQYDVTVKRGRFSSGKHSFSAGAEAWLVRRSSLNIYSHPEFPALASNQDNAYFKTVPFNVYRTRDITDAPDPSVAFKFPVDRYYAPKISLGTLEPTPLAGVPYIVKGTITDQDGDLSFWSVSYRPSSGSEETTVAGGPIENTDEHPFEVPITFSGLDIGIEYAIIVRAKDSTTFIDSYVEEVILKTVSVADSGTTYQPLNVTATGGEGAMFGNVWLSWEPPTAGSGVTYLDYYEIRRAAAMGMEGAEIIGNTGATFFAAPVEDTNTYFFQVRSRDTSGNYSAWTAEVSGNGISDVDATPGPDSITTAMIQNDAIIAEKIGDGEVGHVAIADGAIRADELATNAVVADKINANAVTAAKIATGAVTADAVSSNTIITNTANIQDAVISSAKIIELFADKIATGTLSAAEITLLSRNAAIKSDNFDASNGFKIDGNGNAAFSNLEVRGDSILGSGADGIIYGAFTGSGAGVYIDSPNDLDLDVSGYNRIQFILKREGSASNFSGKFGFCNTSGDTTWQYIAFNALGADEDYVYVDLDLSSTIWGDATLRQVRIYPADVEADGTFSIGYVRIVNEFSSVLDSWEFTTTDEGWTGTGLNVQELEWRVGVFSVLQSANHVPGVSGWAIKSNGSAEFFNVNIYGEVPDPEGFIGSTQLSSGDTYEFMVPVEITLSCAYGCFMMYTTDGSIPTGTHGTLANSGDTVAVGIGSATVRVRSYESATSKTSQVMTWQLYTAPPMICRWDTIKCGIRTMSKPAPYMCVQAYDSHSGDMPTVYRTGTAFYDYDIQQVGWKFDFSALWESPLVQAWDDLWYFFCTSQSISSKVGYVYQPRVYPSSASSANFTADTYVHEQLLAQSYGHPYAPYADYRYTCDRDAYDYPNTVSNWRDN